MKFWQSLQEKGKYATIIGMFIGFPSAGILVWKLIKNGDYLYIPFAIAFGVSLLFFMLPSSISINFKEFKLEIKD